MAWSRVLLDGVSSALAPGLAVVALAAFVSVGVVSVGVSGSDDDGRRSARVGAPRHPGALVLVPPSPPRLGAIVLQDSQLNPDKSVYTVPYGRGRATLTVEPALQRPLAEDLRVGRPQWGATILIDLETGKVLALAEASEREPGVPGAALRPLAQAASVFKIVTASSLVRAGVPLSAEVCGSGGKTRIKPSNLEEGGSRCVRFEDALPLSQNVAIAKLASRFLTPEKLASEAALFGFGKPLSVELEVPPSVADIPMGDDFAFATTAAGFGEVRLSAMHGALLAAVAGTGGLLVHPRIIDSVQGELAPEVLAPERVLDEEQAQLLQGMMSATVERGTAFSAFHGRRTPYGKAATIDVPVAGKTGSLTDRDADVDVTWFVGTAPAHNPQIAIATVVINDEWLWHVRALDVATRALATYFRLHPEDKRVDEPMASSNAPSSASSSMSSSSSSDPSSLQ